MKKVALFMLALLMFMSYCVTYSFADVTTCAKAAVVMDVKTGRVLYSKNPNEKLAMASTTKIMTTLVAIESGRLNEIVTVSKKAVGTEGSSIYLRENEKISVEELLYGIMLRSGNDASMAVAEHIGGSIDGFVEMMNSKAREIGALNTSFANPHGLDNPKHYTTAYDLALITSYALRNPKFAEIVKTKRKTISGPPDVDWDRSMMNKNKMLWQFDGGDGVKTGFTSKAGRCLVASATRDNWQLCSVVLNCGPMWEESSSILNYSFKNYTKQKIVDSSDTYQQLKVIGGKQDLVEIKPSNDFYLPMKQQEIDKIIFIPALKFNNRAPISKGSSAGELKIYLGSEYLGSVGLEYNQSIESKEPLYHFRKIFRSITD
jgi:serine-type D-Ala-D-Ala carboxypeptidase (penicillin-binding protein 5/6)